MKKLTLTLSLFFLLTNVFAQKIELSVQTSAALLHFAGTSTTSQTIINTGATPYTNNPYGKEAGLGYSLGLQAQYIAKGGFIAGVQTGFDRLRSKVDITGVTPQYYLDYNFNYAPFPAKGETYLTTQDINLSPYLGYRFIIKRVKLDLMPGLDLGFNLSLYDRGSAKTTGDQTTYKTNYREPNAPTDVRLKLSLAAMYNRFGVTASYAHGVTNYESNIIGDNSYQAHSELFRFGVSYRIN
ncbi:outer membrane beta-barrel protein [Mucilaginibacter xinganensis]|uniref:Outer membrane protein beta-barrel domain-containing protein n=1 Tax=Mucilaginibacter xinganensis TaxID=1234841 RepID=A0A223P133_9SPHI|nr:outer membrane beta-barrel protein [Mucilaginibacter xinganensis]ASU35548.1 hypothetical protein MuYL_3663 [Mucilaginibacter xinganensis]